MMRQSDRRVFLHRIYHNVHMALWAIGIAGAAALIINIPRMSEARAIAERQRLMALSAENRFYCEKWGMRAGTHEHTLCMLDLQEIRARVEQHIADEMAF